MTTCSCGQRADWAVGPDNVPMCTRCYVAFQESNARQMQILEQMALRAERDMYLVTGLPMPDHLRPRTPVIVRQEVKDNSIRVTGGNVGIINTGTIQQANVSISHVADKNIRAVLEALSRAIETANEAPVEQRTEALELVGAVAEEAAKPPAERKAGIVKTMVAGLGQAVAAFQAAKEIWTIAEPVLRGHFAL